MEELCPPTYPQGPWGKWRDRGDCRNEELMNTVPGELDPLESQSNRTYLKHKNYF